VICSQTACNLAWFVHQSRNRRAIRENLSLLIEEVTPVVRQGSGEDEPIKQAERKSVQQMMSANEQNRSGSATKCP
jgi:hypothetical protein